MEDFEQEAEYGSEYGTPDESWGETPESEMDGGPQAEWNDAGNVGEPADSPVIGTTAGAWEDGADSADAWGGVINADESFTGDQLPESDSMAETDGFGGAAGESFMGNNEFAADIGGHSEGDWIDRALDLDPNRTFNEAILDPFFGQQNGVFTVDEDDSDLEKLGKAAGIVVSMPVWAPATFAGIGLDELNTLGHGPELDRGINEHPIHPDVE